MSAVSCSATTAGDLIAVVGDQQDAAPGQRHASGCRHVFRLIAEAERGRDDRADIGCLHRAELGDPGLGRPLAGGFQRQPRLSAAGRSTQADQRAADQQIAQQS